MELQEFVSKSLQDISAGIAAGNDNKNGDKYRVNSDIDFDLAVTVSNETSLEGDITAKAGIKVLGINADIEAISKDTTKTVSCIHFKVQRQGKVGFAIA